MDTDLIDDEDLSIPRKSLVPGEGFFVPDDLDEQRADAEAADALESAERAVVADPDADGLACVALLRVAFGSAAMLPAGPHDLEDAMERFAEYAAPGTDLFVCDLCPDRFEYVDEELTAAVATAGSVRWFDHHQWDPEVAESVREAGADLVVGNSDEECSADVLVRSLDHEFAEQYVDLARVTRDHDLWLREDERSDDLADYAYWADPEEYVATVREAGADLPEDVLAFLAEQRVEKEALIERAVERAELREVGPWTVGVTYGRCSQNEVAEAMRERGADASVVVKPAGSASIRGTDAFERCHEVAGRVNGGGHPKAAGCKPDIYDDVLDMAHHWTTRGAVTKQVILDAFRAVAAEADVEDGDAGAGADGDTGADEDDDSVAGED